MLNFFPALAATVFYSLSAILAARSAQTLGAPFANVARLILGVLFLAVWTFLWGTSIPFEARSWLWVSGIVGIGLGDVALFGALGHIGPRLTVLMTQCLAAPVALLVEFCWLKTPVHLDQLAVSAAILLGVGLALRPDEHLTVSRRNFSIGMLWGLGAAIGQGGGAVLSRQAGKLADFDGGSAAFQRLLAGTLCTLLLYGVAGQLGATDFKLQKPKAPDLRGGALWALGNALCGPVLGIGCFQWALKSAPAAIVLAIVSTSPLLTMVWLWRLEGQVPRRAAIAGGFIAVAGVIALNRM